ncbi:MAG: pyridoxal phosphate-dependent aminotransferase [Deltaproteobacteria bacterium]|nr:pyridoxal phosphate-dependent aminotransferase [Deltaproteobacteria bacterium]MBW1873323.1 pyridoxal phosphate-dependent aminotransferase [Deltaproteobacteria bacterium]
MAISKKTEDFMTKASFIRKMFEEGIRMRAEVGAENVFDFSLGNPILEPPQEFQKALRDLVNQPAAGLHRYMANSGYPEVRAKVAVFLAQDTGAAVSADDIIMTCGAGGGLNVALKSLLDPNDEVIVVAPYFPEYRFYIDNHGGKQVIAESAEDFNLDLDTIEQSITGHTKAIILNSPNNPTGRMYSAESLSELGDLLLRKSSQIGHPISILSDEPYRKIVYDGLKTPSIFAAYPHTILITSHSKDLGLAGERIGYAAISPEHADRKDLRGAMTFTNRTLGFVNAPALFQQAVAGVQTASVPIEIYHELRDMFCQVLSQAGLQYIKPQGAFYLFPKTPNDDDLAFVQALQKQHILVVPGRGFGRPGYIRISFCVTKKEIEGALPGFMKVMKGM